MGRAEEGPVKRGVLKNPEFGQVSGIGNKAFCRVSSGRE